MTESLLATEGDTARWTCPFCLLLCDNLSVRASASGASLELADGECASARIGLARFTSTPSAATPLIDGHAVDPADAVAAAARMLAASRQPLFGGLGTDVAGARGVYRLACATGAICDAAGGAALMQAVRSLQDRGGFGTTLAEVRTRADLIVCLGHLPSGEAAEFFARCGLGEEGRVPQRHVALLGGVAADQAGLAALASLSGVTTEAIPLHGDLFSTVALLSALVARRAVRDVPLALAALADRLRAARYAVIVGETGRLPAQGALIIEGVHRIVGTLNATTRAAAMWLGGGNGAGTVNEVFTWLSGLPLRSRAGPAGLEHEPLCFDAVRLLADAAVDCLLWISSFDAGSAPPATQAPLIVLGHPDLASSAARIGSVFLPVSTPGIGSAGHLFRADGGAVLPLVPLYRDTLPTLADVLDSITQGVAALRARSGP
ncbi:MAG: formylmethanofuran dehydrogenase [Variovorax sp.]|nr:MAG: formylmethanofuran dehydrogenase [Variovorax sp.]